MKYLKYLAAAAAMTAAVAAHAYGDTIQMNKVGEYEHPASFMHSVCVYKQAWGGNMTVRIVAGKYQCPYSITYDIVNGTWE